MTGAGFEPETSSTEVLEGERMDGNHKICALRNELADALRKGPYQVNMLIGGYDDKDGSASLYYMDYLASCQKITRGAHGYAAYFVLGLLDKLYKKDMTQEEGLDAINQCIKECKKRFIIDKSNFVIKAVNKVTIEVLS
ncbi:proteasome subunit beta type 2, putative [Perkinsus marinus ATCC 50983]|uniref:Proteasome subunit beta type 2, putative n=1 Tax=Perkinsus marinus (strain ATCC 50983 / TXsc) TaxID=423536 RepID=C5KLF7_PERM5|nr:proteasome subunit beta type 2, putative [Perkinsus marinus ATCC 50983]EER14686.1 proteasome subunit beta type 2, putative [Perkinsus marinus ATCC 50983]|eukprot:XP_002782890.1 proteasome subunit beta type 2, putative [Perkinsus marinus ATCC 50983]